MPFAYASAAVPKITLILRKAYGGASLAIWSSVMGAERAVPWRFREELKEAADPGKRKKELIERYREEFSSPYQAAARAMSPTSSNRPKAAP